MKKYLKVLISILITIILCLIIDLIFIFTLNKPLFAIKVRTPYTYTGLLYNTYTCPEYSIPKIKAKGTKFNCKTTVIDIDKVKEIVDTTKEIKDFVCAEALEEFYEDNTYKYYYNCIKSKYVIVKYESGVEETVEKALNKGIITIKDLDNYNIEYIKEEKENNIYINTTKTNNCNNKPIPYYNLDNRNIYTYCLDSITINNIELKEYLLNNNIDSIIDKLNKQAISNDGGTTIYKDGGSTKITNNGLTIIKCNTLDNNKDIYIGPENMTFKSNFCKNNNNTFIRTYNIKDIEEHNKTQYENGIPVTYSNSYLVTLEQYQKETKQVILNNLSYELKKNKTYEFELMLYSDIDNKIEDNIETIFKNTTIVEIRETNKVGLNQIQEKIN